MVNYTEINTIESKFDLQKSQVYKLGQTSVRERLRKLRKLEKAVLKYKLDICEALKKDLGKSETESKISEVFVLLSELRHTKRNLSGWMSDKPIPTPLFMLGSKSYIRHESKGRALIISPWNYPVLLSLSPLIGAIAAGCPAIIKPSEYSYNASLVIEKIVAEAFDEHEVAVVLGGVESAQTLLKLPFDHIYFTGSPSVGKIIMRAASEHLSSVTLELGGKSPVVVTSTAHISKAVERIVFTKYFNNGQICVAPDYILLDRKQKDQFIQRLNKEIKHIFGDSLESRDYTRIINRKHFDRLKDLFDRSIEAGAELISGGVFNEEDLFISPTVLLVKDESNPIMEQEIFGPLLPIFIYDDLKEAVDFINRRDRSLASYIYTSNKKEMQFFLNNTRSGGGAINHGLVQLANYNLPFGGSGPSGFGKAKGIESFLSFTNQRSLVKVSPYISVFDFLGYPFNKAKLRIINFILRWF
jgi:aldehyde dehydrogenase (NAD+)